MICYVEAVPQTDEEKEVHARVSAVLNKGPDILERLSTYPGCEEHIRKVGFPFKKKRYNNQIEYSNTNNDIYI